MTTLQYKIFIPENVQIYNNVNENKILISGPTGQNIMKLPKILSCIFLENEKILNLMFIKEFSTYSNYTKKKYYPILNTYKKILESKILGVLTTYSITLALIGIGYKAAKITNKENSFLQLKIGFSHPINIEIPKTISIEIPKEDEIIINGCDNQEVSGYAAYIRSIKKPEPYKGKGICYNNEIIRRKGGKKNK